MNELINQNAQAMTLKEITDLLKLQHRDGIKIVNKMMQSPEFGDAMQIQTSYKNNFGATMRLETFQLTIRQAIAVKARLDTVSLMKLVDGIDNQQPNISDAKQTISSIELVSIINELRDKNKAKVRHNDFSNKIMRMLDGNSNAFESTYIGGDSQNYRCYNLPKEKAMLMVNNESMAIQEAVCNRFANNVDLHGIVNLISSSKKQYSSDEYANALRRLIEEEIDKQRLISNNEKIKKDIIDLPVNPKKEDYVSIATAASYAHVKRNYFYWRILKDSSIKLGLMPIRVDNGSAPYYMLYPIKAFQMSYPDIDFDDLTPELVGR